MHWTAKLKTYLVLLVSVFLSASCFYQGIAEAMVDTMKFSMLASGYYGLNNRWPNSLYELKEFCCEVGDECFEIDWETYSDITFKTLPDGQLRIEGMYQSTGEPSFIAVVGVPVQQPNNPDCSFNNTTRQ